MKVAIIGGGAAGMMAAASAVLADTSLRSRLKVSLIEKNPILGRKVTISGGGRCNVTTGVLDVREVLTRYPRGDKFLRHAMFSFPPAGVYEWFEKQGVKLKTERDLRVFPRSDNGKEIVEMFSKLFEKMRVEVLKNRQVVRIEKIGEKFVLYYKDQPAEGFDRLIITTGGQAYRHTGSTGEGYSFAEKLGHKITPLAPSLSSFICAETWTASVAGVAMKRATIKARGNYKCEFAGPLLFTHKGITGPAVFALSSLVAYEKFDKNSPLPLLLDLVPDERHSDLEEKLNKELTVNPRKDFLNSLSIFVVRSLATEICNLLYIDPHKNNAELGRKEILRVIDYLKNLPLQAIDRGAGDEFVTAGGVKLSEVDEKTMQSKICPGLYFAGEILDIDGFTGGFNLQAAWATGRLAGESCVS